MGLHTPYQMPCADDDLLYRIIGANASARTRETVLVDLAADSAPNTSLSELPPIVERSIGLKGRSLSLETSYLSIVSGGSCDWIFQHFVTSQQTAPSTKHTFNSSNVRFFVV